LQVPAPFEYERATSVENALELLTQPMKLRTVLAATASRYRLRHDRPLDPMGGRTFDRGGKRPPMNLSN
jgi:hypothetical protein